MTHKEIPMKNTIIQKLMVVVNALNTVSVSGKQNLANLSGSISLLEEIARAVSELNIPEDKPSQEE